MMTPELKKRVDALAYHKLMPVGAIVRNLLQNWLELHEPPHMRPEPPKVPYAPRPKPAANGNGNGKETVTVSSNGNETKATIV